MGLINYSNISDGTSIDASDVNNPFNTIYNEFNGNIEAANIKNGTITQEKLANYADISWSSVPSTNPVTSVSANGNRSYDVTFTSSVSAIFSPGMRLRTTRTVAAPTQCTSLNGTTQYYSKTSPTGMTFTDDFVVSAWVKVSAFGGHLITRYNGTSGWVLGLTANNQVALIGYNSGAANFSRIDSYQSIPLNKWVHIVAQLDMSSFTATTTTSYVMIDGVDVPVAVSRGGTNPTALVQAGNLEIGSSNGGTNPSTGKIAQVAIYSAKVTQANIRATISQGLSGSETSLISAYSFNNSITDLNTTNANNLTANGSAVATNADSPFGYQSDGTISSTLDYGIVTKVATTVATVQVPEGCTIPTTGGVTSISYSTQKTPYGFPVSRGKWVVRSIWKTVLSQVSPVADTWYNLGSANITIPIGQWDINLDFPASADRNTAGAVAVASTFSTSSSAETNSAYTQSREVTATGATGIQNFGANRTSDYEDISAATIYYALVRTRSSTIQTIYQLADRSTMKIDLVLSFL
jgi:hypothetical protein